jgi:hypothetical protein
MSFFGVTFGDPLADDIASLQSTINQYGGAGITNYGGAVGAMQAAGNHAVGAIGPAIDSLSGGDSQVMTMTQWAWSKNGEVAGANSSDSATQDDVNTAKAALQQMATWYGTAYRLAQSKHVAAPATAAPAAAPRPVAVTVAAPRPVVSAATFTPAAVSAPRSAFVLPKMTGPSLALTGGGVLFGLTLGSRLLGPMIGGPLGLVVGGLLGGAIAKKLGV